jgi:hypothetical protein
MTGALSSLLKSDKFDDTSSSNESLENDEFELSLDNMDREENIKSY